MVSHGTTQADRFHSRVHASLFAVSELRASFEDWLSDTPARQDTIEELAIVFSELVTNAVQASPDAGGSVEAAAWIEDGSVVLRVANPLMPSCEPVSQPDLADPLRTGGRGLVIVRAYTDTLRTELDDDTIVIRCERRLAHAS